MLYSNKWGENVTDYSVVRVEQSWLTLQQNLKVKTNERVQLHGNLCLIKRTHLERDEAQSACAESTNKGDN